MDFEKYADRGFRSIRPVSGLARGPHDLSRCALTAANIISTDSRTYRPVFNIVVCEIARLERHCNPVHSGRGAFLRAKSGWCCKAGGSRRHEGATIRVIGRLPLAAGRVCRRPACSPDCVRRVRPDLADRVEDPANPYVVLVGRPRLRVFLPSVNAMWQR
jgi:hypothetical protein